MSRTAHAWAVGQNMKGAVKAVLVVLGDHANDAHRAWPSIPLIARTTGRSERAVQYALTELQAKGAIEIERSIGGRGHVSHYILNLEWTCGTTAPPGAASGHRKGANAAPIRPTNGANAAPIEALNGANTAPIPPETVQSLHPSDSGNGANAAPIRPVNGAILTLNGAKVAPEPKREPKEERKEGSERAPASRRPPAPAPIPVDWQPDKESEQYAADRGVPLAPNVRRFRNTFLSSRKPFADWQARFRKWCDEEEQRLDDDTRGNPYVKIVDQEGWLSARNGYDRDEEFGEAAMGRLIGHA